MKYTENRMCIHNNVEDDDDDDAFNTHTPIIEATQQPKCSPIKHSWLLECLMTKQKRD